METASDSGEATYAADEFGNTCLGDLVKAYCCRTAIETDEAESFIGMFFGNGIGIGFLFCCLFIPIYRLYQKRDQEKLKHVPGDVEMQKVHSHEETKDLSTYLIPFKGDFVNFNW